MWLRFLFFTCHPAISSCCTIRGPRRYSRGPRVSAVPFSADPQFRLRTSRQACSILASTVRTVRWVGPVSGVPKRVNGDNGTAARSIEKSEKNAARLLGPEMRRNFNLVTVVSLSRFAVSSNDYRTGWSCFVCLPLPLFSAIALHAVAQIVLHHPQIVRGSHCSAGVVLRQGTALIRGTTTTDSRPTGRHTQVLAFDYILLSQRGHTTRHTRDRSITHSLQR